METASNTKAKQVITPTSADVANARKVLEDLLASQPLGITATGMIEAAEPISHVSGKSSKGRDYSFWNRRIVLKVGNDGKTVVVAQSADKEDQFEKLDYNGIVSFTIESARMDGSQMILRAFNPLAVRS